MQQQKLQDLADLIFQCLPVEFLPPARRWVADVSLGEEATFLLSGFQRLSTIIDYEPEQADVRGIATHAAMAGARQATIPPFLQRQIHIDTGRLSTWTYLDTYPHLVIGALYRQGTLGDLPHVLRSVAYDGYIGLILPARLFLDYSQEMLFQGYDLLELWEIPFDEQPLVILLAQQRSKSHFPSGPLVLRQISSLQQIQNAKSGDWQGVPTGLLSTERDWELWRSGTLPNQLPEGDQTWEKHERKWLTTCVTEEVLISSLSVTLYVDGLDNEQGQTVPLISAMPGWLLRKDAPFWVVFPYRYRKQKVFEVGTRMLNHFQPQQYMYLSEQELLAGIGAQFHVNLEEKHD